MKNINNKDIKVAQNALNTGNNGNAIKELSQSIQNSATETVVNLMTNKDIIYIMEEYDDPIGHA